MRKKNYDLDRTKSNNFTIIHWFTSFLFFSFSSLDRKSQKNKIKKQQITRIVNQPTKSTSLGNFSFINKVDDTPETTPTTNAAQNDPRRPKEKQW